MKLYEFLERKVTEENVKFKKVETKDGRKAISTITSNGNIYVIDASLKNFEHFKLWPKSEGTQAEIQKTYKKVELSDGTIVPTIRIRTSFQVIVKTKKTRG